MAIINTYNNATIHSPTIYLATNAKVSVNLIEGTESTLLTLLQALVQLNHHFQS